MEIPDEMLKEIRESGYDQELVYNFIRELLNSDKQIKEKSHGCYSHWVMAMKF